MVNLNLPRAATFKGPASVWKRLLAFMIDFMILDLIVITPFRPYIVKFAEGTFSERMNYLSANTQSATLITLIFLFMGILFLLYFTLLEYKTGQTIGKRFMNIKVESETEDISFLAYMVRNMYLLFVFPFSLLLILDPFFLLFSKNKKRLSEILSKTKTIEIYSLNGGI